MATVAVRFVFPGGVGGRGGVLDHSTAPISMHDFLWSKFWIGFVPVLVLTEALTIAANELLGVDPFLKVVAPVAVAVDEPRAGRTGDRSWRPLSALQRRQCRARSPARTAASPS